MIPEPCILAPVSFTEPEPVLRIVTASVAKDVTLAIPSGTEEGPFFLSGDAEADDLIEILLDALNGAAGGVTWTASLSTSNVLTLTASGAAELLWTHANTTLEASLFGFADADTASGTTHAATMMTRACWIPGLDGDPRPVLDDTRDEPVTGAVITKTLDGAIRGYDLSPEADERRVSFYRLEAGRVLAEYAPSSAPYGAFSTLWAEGLAAGVAFRFYDDRTDRETYARYSVSSPRRPWKLEPVENAVRRYELELVMMEAM